MRTVEELRELRKLHSFDPDKFLDAIEAQLVQPLERKEKYMRYLYQVIAIDPEEDTILVNELHIAKSEDSARFKALKDIELGKDLDDFDVIVLALGRVRDKVKPQEVRILKEG